MLFILSAVSLKAQDVSEESGYLSAVIITAGRVEESLKGVSTAVTVIERNDIDRLGASDMGTLLRQYGVQLGEYATGLSVIKMRGFGTNSSPNNTGDIVLLIDGRRIGNENPVMMPLDNIERVEVIRGGAAVQYGSDAHGGVINLITRRGTEQTKFYASQSLGSFKRTATKLGGSGKYKSFDFSITAGQSRRDNYTFPPDHLTFLQTKEYHKYIYSGNFGWNFNENHRLGFIYAGAEGLFGNSGAMTPILRPDGSLYYNGIGTNATNNRESTTRRATYSYDLWYEGKIPEYNLSLQGRYFFGNTIMEQNSDKKANDRLNKYDNDFQGANAIASWNNDILQLTAGLDYYKEDYSQENQPSYTTLYPVNSKASSEDKGVYLLAKVNFLDDKLYLNGGVRYDQYTLTNVMDPNPERNKGRMGTNKMTHTSPAFGLTYLPIDWLKLRINYSNTFKVPTSRQMVNDSINNNNHLVGNPNLKPETAKSVEFGLDATLYNVNFSGTYFMSDFKDKISLETFDTEVVDGVTKNIAKYINSPGKTKFHGMEVYLDWDMGLSFNWDFELRPYVTFTKLFKFHTESGDAERLISKLNLNYGLIFKKPDIDLTASFDVTYYGQQLPSGVINISGVVRPFGKYTVMDFHLSKSLYKWENHGSVSLRVDVYNLTDEFYMNTNQYIMPDRNFLFTIRYDY
jgi:vitamin B12 transporter